MKNMESHLAVAGWTTFQLERALEANPFVSENGLNRVRSSYERMPTDRTHRTEQALRHFGALRSSNSGAVMMYGLLIVCFLVSPSITNHVCAASPEPPAVYTQSQSQRVDASLHAIAFFDSERGVAAGDHGTILRTDNAGLTWQTQSTPVSCRLDDVVWLDERHVLAVGGAYDRVTGISRGVVIGSDDGGNRWQRLDDNELPRLTAIGRTPRGQLAAIGDWSESSMSRHFESRDGGRTWHAADPNPEHPDFPKELTVDSQLAWARVSGNHAPIRSVHRVDEQNLWAAGDHGLILHSQDEGQTWRESRGGGRQAAILVIASDPSMVAWSVVGRETLEMNHRVSMLVADELIDEQEINEQEGETFLDPKRGLTRQAATAIGVAGVDYLPRLGSRFMSELVGWLEVHRPSVVLIDGSFSPDRRQTIAAAAAAADVERVVEYSFIENGQAAGRGMMLHAAGMLARSGVLAGDLTDDAFHLVAPSKSPASTSILRRRYDRTGGNQSGESVASGIQLVRQQKLSPRNDSASRRQLQVIQARMSEDKRIAELFGRSDSVERYSSTLKLLLDQTADTDRFRLSWDILRRVRTESHGASSRQIAFYEATLREFISRHSSLSAGHWAQLRLDAITHSLEWNRLRDSLRHEVDPTSTVKAATAEIVPVSPFQNELSGQSDKPSRIASSQMTPPQDFPTRWDDSSSQDERFGGGVRQASATVPVLVADQITKPIPSKSDVSMSRVDLAWEFHPAVVIAREAARLRGDNESLQSTRHNANLDRIAATESKWSRLLRRRGAGVVSARRATAPPRLDGLFDDPCWDQPPASAETTPTLQVAYDEQYVYVAIRCRSEQLRIDQADTSVASARDQDLTDSDRIRLRLDTDKDLLTSLQFQTTDAGRTHDSVDGHSQWQPTWYVATNRTEHFVDIELALLRQDITDLPIHPGESWFVSAQTLAKGIELPPRTIPQPSEWVRVEFR